MNLLEVIKKRANCAFGSNILDEMLADASKSKEETCREVIQYLKEVIETRGIQQN